MKTIGELQKKVRNASQLRISNSVDESSDELLNMKSYSGVVEYFPEELVITVKAGTLIKDISQTLRKKKSSAAFLYRR